MKNISDTNTSNRARRLYLNVSALQSFPYSNPNRDKTGAPKGHLYGGTWRQFITSQCIKKAMRDYFGTWFDDETLRTSDTVPYLCECVAKEANISEAEAEKYVLKFTKPSKAFGKEGKGENNMFYSRAQFDGIVDLVLRAYMEDPKNVSKENIKEFRNRITKLPSATQILFGRMIALDKDLAYDGACQFADAFTVNEARLEPDLFIVVSDPLREGEKKRGGAYLDTRLGASGTYYRYANINLSTGSELFRHENLSAAKVCAQFVEAFVKAVPTGMIHSYAHCTIPDRLIVEIRDAAVNYCPAFEKAITSRQGYAKEASLRLDSYKADVDRIYGEPLAQWDMNELSLNEIKKQIEEEVERRTGNGGTCA